MSQRSQKDPHRERGSIFTVLLGAVAAVGVLSVAAFNILAGPVATLSKTNQLQMTNQQLDALSRVILDTAIKSAGGGDCDADNYIEPPAYTGSNKLPVTLGLPQTDPWGTDYLYCPFDVGTVDNAGCGGAGALLTNGSPTPAAGNENTRYVFAIASAGADRIMQTTCAAYVNGTTAIVTPGGDDVVRTYTYAQAVTAAPDLWTLKTGDPTTATIAKNLEIGASAAASMTQATGLGTFATLNVPASVSAEIVANGGIQLGQPSACTGSDVGLLRYNTTSKKVEVCSGTAWVELSGSGGGGGDATSEDYTSSLIGHWRFDETAGTAARDSSGYGRDGVLTGGPVWQGSGGKVGGALRFDGVDDRVVVGTNSTPFINMPAYTVCAWISPENYGSCPNCAATVVTTDWGTGNAGIELDVTPYYSGVTNVVYNTTPSAFYGASNGGVPLNKWTHACSHYDHAGDRKVRVFVNGVEPTYAEQWTVTGALYQVSSWPLSIGARYNGLYYQYKGKIDDVRIYNRALTATQIQALYDATKGDTTDNDSGYADNDTTSGLSAWFKMNESSGTAAADSSGNGFSATLANGPTWQPTGGAIDGAVQLDGINDYLYLLDDGAQSLDFQYGEPITISLWFYKTEPANLRQAFVTKGALATRTANFQFYKTSGNLLAFDFSDSVNAVDASVATSAAHNYQNAWAHYAVTFRYGHPKSITFYVNGAKVNAGNWPFGGSNYNQPVVSNAPIIIGGRCDITTTGNCAGSVSSQINSKIDDVRIYKRYLSPAQIAALYAQGSGSTPPPADTTSGMLARWNFEETSGTTAVDSVAGTYNGTLNGNASFSTNARVGAGSLLLTKDGDYVSFAKGTLDTLSTGTITAWMKATGASSQRGILSDGGNPGWNAFYLDESSSFDAYLGWSSQYQSSYCCQDQIQNWHHYAYTSSPSGNAMYIDGVRVIPNYASGNTASQALFAIWTNANYLIGALNSAGGSFLGFMDDVRIYNRALSATDIAALYAESTNGIASGDDLWERVAWYNTVQYDDGDVLIGTQIHDPSDKYILDIVGDSDDTLLSTVSNRGLVGWWKFDETSGTTAADSSGSGNTGTLYNFPGSPPWNSTAGRIGGSLAFAAPDDTIAINGSPASLDDLELQGGGGMTVALWMKLASNTNGSYYLAAKSIWPSVTGAWWFKIINDTGNTDYLEFGKDYATTDLSATFSACAVAMTVTNWNHVTLTWTGGNTSASVRAYVNGVSCGAPYTFNIPAGAKVSDAADDFTISYYNSTAFNGQLDDVRVYNRILSDGEIRKLALRAPDFNYTAYRSTAAHGANLQLERQRGVVGTPVAPSNGDDLGSYRFYGRRSGAWYKTSEINAQVANNPAANLVPARINIFTMAESGTDNWVGLDYVGLLSIGDNSKTLSWGVGSGADRLNIVNYYTNDDLWLNSYNNVPELILRRSRGSLTAPTAMVSSNAIGMLGFSGYDTNSFTTTAGMYGVAQGTINTTAMPTDLRLSTSSTGITNTSNDMAIKSNGSINIGLGATTASTFALEVGGNSALMVSPSTTGTAEVLTGLSMPSGGYMVIHGEKGSFRAGHETAAWTLSDSMMPDVSFNWGSGNTVTDHAIVIGTSSTATAKRAITLAHNATNTAENGINMTRHCTINGPTAGTDITTGLVGWWKLDETSGTSATDSSGSNNTGTLANGPVWTKQGTIAGTLKFDGVDDKVEVPNATSLGITGAMTLSAWVKLDTNTTAQAIISRNFDASNRGYSLQVHSVDSHMYFYVSGDCSAEVGIGSGSPVQTGQWIHWTAVYEPGVAVRLYKNGTLLSFNTTSIPASLCNNAKAVGIGQRVTGSTAPWPVSGHIDDARIYNRALSAADVKALYQYAGDPTSGLAAHYKLDETSGTTAADSSGNNNTGTVSGNPQWATPRAGESGKALVMDGTGDYITAPNTAANNISGTALTLSAWVATHRFDSGSIVGKPWNAASIAEPIWQYGLEYNSGYGIEFHLGDTTSTRHTLNYLHLPEDGWEHWAATYDGQFMKLYINGILIKSQAETGSIQARGNTLRIGANGNLTNNFEGGVDDIRIYNRALSQNEIEGLVGLNRGAVGGICVGGQGHTVNGPRSIAVGGHQNEVHGEHSIAMGRFMRVYGDYSVGINLESALTHVLDQSNTLAIMGGNLGIGTLTPAHAIAVTGTAGLTTGTAWTNTSDIRLKDIDGDYEKGLTDILKLHTVRFHYKEGNPLGLASDTPMTGFIAQEILPVFPDAVWTRKDGYLEFDIHPVNVAMVNAVQELGRTSEKQAGENAVINRSIGQSADERARLSRDLDKLSSLTESALLSFDRKAVLALIVPAGVLVALGLSRRRGRKERKHD